MDESTGNPTSSVSSNSEENIIDFLITCGNLKRSKRTGWIRCHVDSPESIADHMYRMSICCLFIPTTEKVDREKCIKMALIHDIAESIVGDITPFCNVPVEKKHQLEKEACEHFERLLGYPVGQEILDLWNEYEAGKTSEARYVHDIDKFEMVLQAYEYEKDQNMKLDSFFDSTRGYFKTNLFKRLDANIIMKRLKLHHMKHPKNGFVEEQPPSISSASEASSPAPSEPPVKE